ncbi:MAG: dTMP kinase [Pseudomonadota bacterium]
MGRGASGGAPPPVWPVPAPGALFVTLEGVDGAGKSTQARRLAAALRAAGREVVETREPGGTEGAEEIRRLLVTGGAGRWSAETEALLFTAARRDHVERVIAPALAAGKVVLSDRFADSTRAYQGAAGGAEALARVEALHAAMIGLEPDLTLILDMDPAAATARALARMEGGAAQPRAAGAEDRAAGAGAGAEDRFERRGAAFQAALRAGFRAIAEGAPERCAVVDADRPADALAATLWDRLEAALAARLADPAGPRA